MASGSSKTPGVCVAPGYCMQLQRQRAHALLQLTDWREPTEGASAVLLLLLLVKPAGRST